MNNALHILMYHGQSPYSYQNTIKNIFLRIALFSIRTLTVKNMEKFANRIKWMYLSMENKDPKKADFYFKMTRKCNARMPGEIDAYIYIFDVWWWSNLWQCRPACPQRNRWGMPIAIALHLQPAHRCQTGDVHNWWTRLTISPYGISSSQCARRNLSKLF